MSDEIHNIRLNSEQFLTAASIAAEVYHAVNIAKQLSFTSINARVLAKHSGDTVLGFSELTKFIGYLATYMIDKANLINQLAIQLTNLTAQLYRSHNTLDNMQQAERKFENIEYIDSLNVSKQTLIKQIQHQHEDYQQLLKCLKQELDAVYRKIKSAELIAVMSRIETAEAPKNSSASFDEVANKIAQSGDTIMAHISRSLQLLSAIYP